MTPATEAKRKELLTFIERVLEPEPEVQSVVGIGSIATDQIGPASDIDIAVFFDPMDWYIIPAEFIWNPVDGSYHSIFEEDPELRQEGIELDCLRLDLRLWSDPAFEWPEGRKSELAGGWVAFDRDNRVAPLIAQKTAYPEAIQLERMDEAIVWLDQHLGSGRPEEIWERLGPAVAHDRLQAAFQYLVQGLFAYNRRWIPWRNRQMKMLLDLPWLPVNFADRVVVASNAPGLDRSAYEARAGELRALFQEMLSRVVEDGLYSATPIDQAFIRSHDEPGYAWNMEEWRSENVGRFLGMLAEVETEVEG